MIRGQCLQFSFSEFDVMKVFENGYFWIDFIENYLCVIEEELDGIFIFCGESSQWFGLCFLFW